MSSTSTSTRTGDAGDVGAIQRRLLDGLMASDATAWEHSLYRTRLYAGYEDPLDCWVPRSHAAMRERAGKWGTPPSQMHGLTDEDGRRDRAPFNSQVSKAHASLTAGGLWERRRRRFGTAQDGPRTPWETRLRDVFPAERAPARSTLAYAAIRSLSLHVSPLGPAREVALCRTWFRVARDNTLVGKRKQWAEWLGCKSERWAAQWLRDFAAADVGVELEVLPPSGREKAKLYVVRLSLPPIERMVCPSGGRRRQEDEDAEHERFGSWASGRDQEQEIATARTEPAAPITAAARYAQGPGGKMMPWTPPVEKEDLPEEFYGRVEERVVPAAVAERGMPTTEAASEEPRADEEVTEEQSAAEESRECQAEIESPAPPAADSAPESETATGDGVPPSAGAQPSPQAELATLWERLWYKDLVQSAMDLAELQLKDGRKLSLSRRLNNFVRPVLALQEQYQSHPPLLRYALEKTIEGPSLCQPDTHGWNRYLAKVCTNNEQRFTGDKPTPGTNAAVKLAHSPDKVRERLCLRLRDAYDLNKCMKTEPAKAEEAMKLLWALLAATDLLADTVYEGDRALARASIIESFKRGASYELIEEQHGGAAFLNYLPKSVWPHATPLAGEAEGVHAAKSAEKAPAGNAPVITSPSSGPAPERASTKLDRFPSQPMDFDDAADS
jgi:hypothetical protein